MKRKFATLVRTAGTKVVMFALSAVLGGMAVTPAMHAQSTTTYGGSLHVVRGDQSVPTGGGVVVLMTIPGLGQVTVNCPSGPLTGIAFFPSVSGSLWFTHGGATGFASGSSGTEMSRQGADDVVTAQFATPTKTVTMVISGHPGSTCTYDGQAIVQP
jgi:hypothetical protein